jgi:uncharacterized protein with HEPN domain
MKRRDDLFLIDIVAAATEIASYLDRQTKDVFLSDRMMRDATLMQLLVIGEAASRTPRPVRDRHPEVDWETIVGFRNRAIHAYRAVDWNIVWNAATVNVPILALQIVAILDQEFPAAISDETKPQP